MYIQNPELAQQDAVSPALLDTMLAPSDENKQLTKSTPQKNRERCIKKEKKKLQE